MGATLKPENLEGAADDSTQALTDIMGGILRAADEERKKSESYKGLFTEDTLDGLMRALDRKMIDSVLSATAVLKEKYGYEHVGDDAFYILLAMPFLANKLEKYIEKTEGSACCVDKTYFLLGSLVKAALEADPRNEKAN